MIKKKVAVAMSGGVDSGVAAALLVKQGFECTGFHMHLWSESQKGFENKCCSTESLEAARKTAHQLGMPFFVIDFSKIFKKRVVDYFLKEYASGLTPNPCVMCNKFIKFGELLRYVRKLGFDYLSTGHYARVLTDDLIFHLLMAKDKSKDQTYFLYNLIQKQLAHIVFPVGNYKKKQVVAMAKKWKLAVAHRPESQEICFFPETDYRPFLRRNIYNSIKPGEVVDAIGRVIGRHHGLPLYTIGQRHGFEIRGVGPFYVIRKNVKKNQLVVGFGKETERKEFWVKDVSWVLGRLERLGERKIWVKIRHQGELLNCKLSNYQIANYGRNKPLKVTLDEAERGIAPEQAAVFYLKEEVLGGGIIVD